MLFPWLFYSPSEDSPSEFEENHRELAAIIDVIITLERLGLPFHGHCGDSKYHPNVGEYSRFIGFQQFRHG